MDEMESAVPLRTALSGFRLPLEGWRLLRREQSLWPVAVVPVLISMLVLSAAVGGVVAYATEIHGWATDWTPVLTAERWWEWLWIGPGRALLFLIGLSLFLAIAAACVVAAFLLASLLASPFHDALASRVERLIAGGAIETGQGGFRGVVIGGLRAALEELKRVACFLAATLPLVVVGMVVPGAQLITGPLLVGVTVFFLPLDYVSYTLDRRQLSFSEKRSWLSANRPSSVGFGAAAFLACLVPGFNFFAMPVLVVAGTLLAIRGQAPPTSR